MDQVRIFKEMREASKKSGADRIRPNWFIWENVPGALSSNGSEDFRAVLEEVCRIADPEVSIPRPPKGKWQNSGAILGDGYSVAWRVTNSQYWGMSITDNEGKVVKRGTPQRRRRIALVACFGGHDAPRVLFEEVSPVGESVSGDIDESESAWEGASSGVENGSYQSVEGTFVSEPEGDEES